MKRIVRTSKLPLYYQLYEILRENILSREWQPGDKVPSEAELIDRHEVSRTTVRQVLDMLASEGLIDRQPGRGTFVAHPTVEQALVRIISFTEDMQQRGETPGTHVLSSGLTPAPQDIAERLGIEVGEELARLERLRLAGGEPMGVEESYLVHRYCRGVLLGNYAATSLRQALDRQYGVRLVRAKQIIRAIPAPPKLARLLSVPPRSATLYIERVSYSQDDIAVEFLRTHYRGDRYSLYNELQG